MSFRFSKLALTAHTRMTSAVVGVSLAAVGSAIYLSPAGTHATHSAPDAATQKEVQAQSSPGGLDFNIGGSGGSSSSAKPTPTKSKTPKPTKSTTPTSGGGGGGGGGPTVIHAPGTTDVVVVKQPITHTVTDTVSPKSGKVKHCGDYRWQQDAQAAYLANLSDPAGLDGLPGPNNGDGIACNDQPVDPSRAKSVPVDAYQPPAPSVGEKAALVSPAKKYFGVAEDGLPGDTGEFNALATSVNKAPSLVEWFANWPQNPTGSNVDFRSDLVTAAWSRGAMPVISWQSGNGDHTASDPYVNRLSEIVHGNYDAYLQGYAAQITALHLPVVIRFDHEMNGNWYDWSAGRAANVGAPGQPNMYVQAWQHIWNVFNSMNANQYVIWAWTPDRIDGLKTTSGICTAATCTGTIGETDMAADFPGAGYVDWVGLSAYAWQPPTVAAPWTYAATFAKTIANLKQVAPGKPIYIAETGASQQIGSPAQDATAIKTAWINDTLKNFAADPSIVGFAYFNNNISNVHNIGGVPVQTNWTINSSTSALNAFRAGIDNPAFSSGIMPN